MKDSEGRDYDGWCMKYPEDWKGYGLASWTFGTTRVDAWHNLLGTFATLGDRERWHRKIRRAGYRAVKVRLVEVVE